MYCCLEGIVPMLTAEGSEEGLVLTYLRTYSCTYVRTYVLTYLLAYLRTYSLTAEGSEEGLVGSVSSRVRGETRCCRCRLCRLGLCVDYGRHLP